MRGAALSEGLPLRTTMAQVWDFVSIWLGLPKSAHASLLFRSRRRFSGRQHVTSPYFELEERASEFKSFASVEFLSFWVGPIYGRRCLTLRGIQYAHVENFRMQCGPLSSSLDFKSLYESFHVLVGFVP